MTRKTSHAVPEWDLCEASLDGITSPYLARDVCLQPWQVTWETTQRCEWKPGGARAAARDQRNKRELSTAEAFHLVEEVASLRVPLLALIGGDPLMRLDLIPILQYASRRSVRTSATLLPTSLVTPESIVDLKEADVMRTAFWIHAPNAAAHDAFCGRRGAFQQTLQAIAWCHELEVPVQINTAISRRNVHDIDPMIDLLSRFDIVLWSVFFFVPAGPEQAAEMLSAADCEGVFAKFHAASRRVEFQIKTTEGPHYQRYLLQQRARESRGRLSEVQALTGVPAGMGNGKGFVFIDCRGEIYPSRFLPMSAGNITTQSLASIYRESSLFTSLRDVSKLTGKCGRCSAHTFCGGSRARAYAVTGDLFAEEPCCSYQPQ